MISYRKEDLEFYVPSLRSATEEISVRVGGFFLESTRRVCQGLGFLSFEDLELVASVGLLSELVYREAARLALSSLDIVATATGFGVVSNGNIAPASGYRVAALREDLRVSTSRVRDELLSGLILSDSVPRGFIERLVFMPTIARNLGLTKDGKLVYDEEFAALQSVLYSGEMSVRRQMGVELYSVLVSGLCRPSMGAPYRLLASVGQRAVVGVAAGVSGALDELTGVLNDLADVLPEYKTSSTYVAQHSTGYENKADDPCYFM